MRLYCDANVEPRRNPVCCRWLFGFNLPLYALGWQFAPQASGTDGRFDVCTFRAGKLFHGLRYLWHVLRQRHCELADAEMMSGSRLRIECADGIEIPFQLDGDYAGVLPVDVEVLPSALKLLAMPAAAERLGFVAPDSRMLCEHRASN
jgi:diacylglycerol kinase family enzyme